MERMRALILTLLVAACASVAQPPDSTARAQQQVMIAPAPYGLTRPDGMPEMEEVAVPHTAICADGWYSYNNRRRGTCAGHGGVRSDNARGRGASYALDALALRAAGRVTLVWCVGQIIAGDPMFGRRILLALVATTVSACLLSPQDDPPASPDFVVESVAERTLDTLPSGALYWRIESFPTLENAQAAATSASLAAVVSGRAWLVTLGERGARTPGAAHVAEIGPIPRIEARRYLLRLNHAHAPPGAATSVHKHPGSEAFYVITGQLSQRTVHGVARIDAGETMNGHVPGMVMQLQSTGGQNLDQLVLFVVDADRPFSSPATFER